MTADPDAADAAWVLGPRFASAVEWTIELHGGQTRKGGDVPYVAHLLEVAALVLHDGGSEAEAIAGLLHDDARRVRLGEAGRRRAVATFARGRVEGEWRRAYDDALRNGG